MSPESPTIGLSGKNAALLKGGEEARAYVVERVGHELKKEKWPPLPSDAVIIFRPENDPKPLKQHFKENKLPPDLFSRRYSRWEWIPEILEHKSQGMRFEDIEDILTEAARHKAQLSPDFSLFAPLKNGPSVPTISTWLKNADITLMLAHQPNSEVPAITFAPSPRWRWDKERRGLVAWWGNDEWPSIVLVCMPQIDKGIKRRQFLAVLREILRRKMRQEFLARTLSRLNEMYARVPPVKKRRVVEIVERGRVGEMVKAHRGHKCQVCEALGREPLVFDKSGGGIYAEAHHVDPVAVGGGLGPENIIVVCAHHHRQIHHGKTELAGKTPGEFVFRIDGEEVSVERYSPKG